MHERELDRDRAGRKTVAFSQPAVRTATATPAAAAAAEARTDSRICQPTHTTHSLTHSTNHNRRTQKMNTQVHHQLSPRTQPPKVRTTQGGMENRVKNTSGEKSGGGGARSVRGSVGRSPTSGIPPHSLAPGHPSTETCPMQITATFGIFLVHATRHRIKQWRLRESGRNKPSIHRPIHDFDPIISVSYGGAHRLLQIKRGDTAHSPPLRSAHQTDGTTLPTSKSLLPPPDHVLASKAPLVSDIRGHTTARDKRRSSSSPRSLSGPRLSPPFVYWPALPQARTNQGSLNERKSNQRYIRSFLVVFRLQLQPRTYSFFFLRRRQLQF